MSNRALVSPHVNREDVHLGFALPREQIPPVTEIRSTWLTSSLRSLRDRGHYEQYLTALPRALHAEMESLVAGTWVAIDFAMAHYRACDALSLTRAQRIEIADDVIARVHGTSLDIIVRLARRAGVTPWTVLARLDLFWERVCRGGGVAVYRGGPKEAVVEIVQCPLAAFHYVRATLPAVAQGIARLCSEQAYVTEIPAMGSDTTLAMRVQWV